MACRRQGKLKQIKENKPPFAPLSAIDAQLVGTAGGLNCANDDDFYDELEMVRRRYLPRTRLREFVVPDNHIRAEIEDALRQLAKLKAFFSRPSMALASQILYLDNPGASGAVPDVEHPDRLRAFAKQIDALLYLDGWVRDLADRFERKGYGIAPKSAEKPGRNDLVLDLADLWRRRSGETELSVGRKSCWIKFLQQGLATIADLSVTGDAARKMTMRALKYEPSQMRQAAKRPLEI